MVHHDPQCDASLLHWVKIFDNDLYYYISQIYVHVSKLFCDLVLQKI